VKTGAKVLLTTIIVCMVLPMLLYPETWKGVILVSLITIASRSSSIYDNLKLEFHSVFLIAAVATLGLSEAMYAIIMSTIFLNPAGKILGNIQKIPWVIMDMISLFCVVIVVSFAPPHLLYQFSLWSIILITNVLFSIIRNRVFFDPLDRRIAFGFFNTIGNYFLLTYYFNGILGIVANTI
jgi:hypothetical protein